MILLKIKKPGLVISVPGAAQVRSPAEIDVSSYDIRKLVAYLATNSITEYEILSSDIPSKIIKEKIEKIKKEKIVTAVEGGNIENRLDKLEEMLSYLVKKRKYEKLTNNYFIFEEGIVAEKKEKY